jgi:hypothetical protein
MMLSAMLLMSPTDGSTVTCTDSAGKTVTVNDPGAGIPLIGGWLNSLGNAVTGTDCTQDNGSSIPGMIHDAATTITSTSAPVVADPATDQATGVASFLQSHTLWLTVLVMILAISIMGAKIAWNQGRRGTLDLEALMALLAGYVVTAGIGAGAVALVAGALDAMGAQILTDAATGDYEKSMTDMIGNVPMGLGDIAAIAMGVLVWLAVGLQILILHVINAALPIAVGLWPLAYAVHGLQSPQAFKNRLTPLIATLATYKFIACCIYAGGFTSIAASGTAGGPSAWDGVLLLLIAVAAFPVLYKALAPWVGAAPMTGLSLGAVGGAAAMSMRMAR